MAVPQVRLPASQPVCRPLTVEARPTGWQITGEDFSYHFSRTDGSFDSLVRAGRELLDAPMKLDVYRAPHRQRPEYPPGLVLLRLPGNSRPQLRPL